MDAIEELLTRRVNEVFPAKETLKKELVSGKKLRLYQGFDPSKPNLHIGHLVGLLQLKMFQDLGHEVIFLIGDFTGMIGDPTDKSATRPKLTREEVVENAKTYKEQAGRILRFEGDNAAQIKFNSEWLDKLNFQELIELSSSFTVQQMIERDMFQERIKEEKPIFLHEFLYPLMVTYDAIAMKVDLEVGGSDQLFNMTVGRHLVKEVTGKEKYAITTKLLTDSEGKKIGKTSGNAINLFGPANDLYGQVMALPDSAIVPFFTLATALALDEVQAIETEVKNRPMEQKKRLAFEITKLCQGEEAAKTAEAHFTATVQKGEVPREVEEVSISEPKITALELCKQAGVGESNSQIKRTIEQGGVEVSGKKILNPNEHIVVANGAILKFGKRTFKKIKLGE